MTSSLFNSSSLNQSLLEMSLPQLPKEYHDALQELAVIVDLTPAQTLIQALRVYQMQVVRTQAGCTKVWYDPVGNEMDVPVGCPALD